MTYLNSLGATYYKLIIKYNAKYFLKHSKLGIFVFSVSNFFLNQKYWTKLVEIDDGRGGSSTFQQKIVIQVDSCTFQQPQVAQVKLGYDYDFYNFLKIDKTDKATKWRLIRIEQKVVSKLNFL